jgi:hypothetical protein
MKASIHILAMRVGGAGIRVAAGQDHRARGRGRNPGKNKPQRFHCKRNKGRLH